MIRINGINYTGRKIVIPNLYEGEILELSSDATMVTWDIKEFPKTQDDTECFFNTLTDQHMNPSIFNPERLTLELIGTYYILATEKDSNGNYSQTKIYIRSNSFLVEASLPFNSETDEISNKGWGIELLEYVVNLSNLVSPLLLDKIECGNAIYNGNENLISCGQAERIVGMEIECGDAILNCTPKPIDHCTEAEILTEMADDDHFCIADINDLDDDGNPKIKKVTKENALGGSDATLELLLGNGTGTVDIVSGDNVLEMKDENHERLDLDRSKMVHVNGEFYIMEPGIDIFKSWELDFTVYSPNGSTVFTLIGDLSSTQIADNFDTRITNNTSGNMFSLDLSNTENIVLNFTPNNTGADFTSTGVVFKYTVMVSR